MKKLLVIAAASCFTIISCSKVEPTPVTQQNSVSQAKIFPVPPAPITPQKYVITNIETDRGVVEYRIKYTDASGAGFNVPLPMGQSITLCLSNTADVSTNFAYTIKAIGDCN